MFKGLNGTSWKCSQFFRCITSHLPCKFHENLLSRFFRNVANIQTYTDRQTSTKATDNDENITFAMAEVINLNNNCWQLVGSMSYAYSWRHDLFWYWLWTGICPEYLYHCYRNITRLAQIYRNNIEYCAKISVYKVLYIWHPPRLYWAWFHIVFWACVNGIIIPTMQR